jgi:hypothetical protein
MIETCWTNEDNRIKQVTCVRASVFQENPISPCLHAMSQISCSALAEFAFIGHQRTSSMEKHRIRSPPRVYFSYYSDSSRLNLARYSLNLLAKKDSVRNIGECAGSCVVPNSSFSERTFPSLVDTFRK